MAGDLRADLHRATGVEPAVGHDEIPAGRDPVILSTSGKSPSTVVVVVIMVTSLRPAS